MSPPTFRPQNMIDLSAALVLELRGNDENTNAKLASKELLKALPVKESYRWISSTNSPPWIDPELSAFIETPNARTLIVLTESVTTLATAISFYALEMGYRTFLVIQSLDGSISTNILRLTQSGVVVIEREAFEQEIQLISN